MQSGENHIGVSLHLLGGFGNKSEEWEKMRRRKLRLYNIESMIIFGLNNPFPPPILLGLVTLQKLVTQYA